MCVGGGGLPCVCVCVCARSVVAAAADPRCYLDVHQFPLDASTLRTRKTKNPVAFRFVFWFFWRSS